MQRHLDHMDMASSRANDARDAVGGELELVHAERVLVRRVVGRDDRANVHCLAAHIPAPAVARITS